ncbi:ATP-binding protein [Pseudomonas sp. FP1154]|uniref:histidine kinase n=1 Tax=Pseudomonas rhizophila TaxID=2045200 RepID=A0ABM6UG97_9PSED|nr:MULTISPECIES: ATP-binding protein [Pseudomonas]AVU76541.1 two-component sensor histidine kinase [Pseudomonas rhizophila]MEA1030862.1 ATP-binding protein [Pseudomonas sp. N-137]WLG25154.1 ATP-binding protein [Pseudomonas sp. FP1154]SIS08371.1 Signal transduction histidine kinase [Pseudomonas sp. A214]
MKPRHSAFHRPRDTVARWIALTTMLAMLTLLALNELFGLLAGTWARPPLMETGLMEKAAAITRIIDSVAPGQRPDIARAASDQAFTAQWLPRREDARVPVIDDPQFSEGATFLRKQLGRPEARIEAFEPGDWPADQPDRRYAVLIQLADDSWVEFSVASRSWGLKEWMRNLIIIGLILLSTFIVALIATRHLATPLERFAEGARRFGVDFRAPPIPVVGPHEIRQAILAFNAMQAQLQHFVQDRTQMLAAISHDLRAPLTRMRLRGEFIDDAEQQSRLFRDVDEMQAMVNSALEFFRDEARLEHATAFDLAELLHTVVDDFKDAGTEVSFEGAPRFVYMGRPIGIKRALVNLIDNASKYGSEPGVQLKAFMDRVEIRVHDRGPGIAPQFHEQVFAPFFRIEGSRNKHTGGVGLGLSAARATVLEHGGTLTLRNRRGGGLEVKVSLPLN